jgi:hypothetical protein
VTRSLHKTLGLFSCFSSQDNHTQALTEHPQSSSAGRAVCGMWCLIQVRRCEAIREGLGAEAQVCGGDCRWTSCGQVKKRHIVPPPWSLEKSPSELCPGCLSVEKRLGPVRPSQAKSGKRWGVQGQDSRQCLEDIVGDLSLGLSHAGYSADHSLCPHTDEDVLEICLLGRGDTQWP